MARASRMARASSRNVGRVGSNLKLKEENIAIFLVIILLGVKSLCGTLTECTLNDI